jgi:hypothetical protein
VKRIGSLDFRLRFRLDIKAKSHSLSLVLKSQVLVSKAAIEAFMAKNENKSVLPKVLRFHALYAVESQDYRKLRDFKQIFVGLWLHFRMVAMLLSIFDSYCQVAKPLKAS